MYLVTVPLSQPAKKISKAGVHKIMKKNPKYFQGGSMVLSYRHKQVTWAAVLKLWRYPCPYKVPSEFPSKEQGPSPTQSVGTSWLQAQALIFAQRRLHLQKCTEDVEQGHPSHFWWMNLCQVLSVVLSEMQTLTVSSFALSGLKSLPLMVGLTPWWLFKRCVWQAMKP